MSGIEFNIFYKEELPLGEAWASPMYDVFVSAFNSSERVNIVYEKVTSGLKFWLLHHEYGYETDEYPAGSVLAPTSLREAAFIREAFEQISKQVRGAIANQAICIDITGFMRPHLLYTLAFLENIGVKSIDVLYTEPLRYKKKEKTRFSDGEIVTRAVEGYEGINSADATNDFLIIGSGYDARLIKAVAEHKGKADKVQVFGLPSLKADMYQENVLASLKATEAVGTNRTFDQSSFFAPANDPFATASVIDEIVKLRLQAGPISHLYLCPLATKAQAVGFGLYFLHKAKGRSVSMLFPVSSAYERETSEGLSKVWRYTIEF